MDRMEGTTGTRTWPEWVVLTFGVVYLAVGALGFAVTGGVGFADTEGKSLLGFEVNPLHNIAHLAIGAALVAGFLGGRRPAGVVAMIIGATYLLLAIVGPFVTGTEANILALNSADHVLHAISAIVLLWAGIVAARSMGGTGERPTDLRRAA